MDIIAEPSNSHRTAPTPLVVGIQHQKDEVRYVCSPRSEARCEVKSERRLALLGVRDVEMKPANSLLANNLLDAKPATMISPGSRRGLLDDRGRVPTFFSWS